MCGYPPPRALAVFIYQPCDRFKEFAAYSVGLASAPARKQTSRRHRSITDQDPDQGKFAAPISIQSDSSHRRSDGRRRRSSVTDRGGGCAQRAGGNGTRTAHMHIAAHRAYARTASTAGIKCALQHTHGVLTPPQAATRGHLVRRSERRHEHGVLASADPAQRHDTPAMPVMPGRSALDVGMDVAGLVHVHTCARAHEAACDPTHATRLPAHPTHPRCSPAVATLGPHAPRPQPHTCPYCHPLVSLGPTQADPAPLRLTLPHSG